MTVALAIVCLVFTTGCHRNANVSVVHESATTISRSVLPNLDSSLSAARNELQKAGFRVSAEKLNHAVVAQMPDQSTGYGIRVVLDNPPAKSNDSITIFASAWLEREYVKHPRDINEAEVIARVELARRILIDAILSQQIN